MLNLIWGKPQKCVDFYTNAEYTAHPVTLYAGYGATNIF